MFELKFWKRYQEGQRALREVQASTRRKAYVNTALLAARHYCAESCDPGELFKIVSQQKCFDLSEMARVTLYLATLCGRGTLPVRDLVAVVTCELERLEAKRSE